MFVELKINNCFSFNMPVKLSASADMRTKKFATNIFKNKDFNILKTIGIYGPNNTGKSNIVRTFEVIKNILLNKKFNLMPNIFNKNPIIELCISFIYENEQYIFEIIYDEVKSEFVSESFSKVLYDAHKNKNTDPIYIKDTINEKYLGGTEELEKALKTSSNTNILIYTLNVDMFPNLKIVKDILVSFANKIEIIKLNNIPISKTLSILKNKNSVLKEKIVNFIKNADLYLDDFKYDDKLHIDIPEDIELRLEENSLKLQNILEQVKLVSTYKGVEVPSLLFDSTGTKKLTALASYIIEALEDNKILIIDELDSSLHFKLTRAIISMFHNELNRNAQLIFTTHDISLMDTVKLFRKEQLWFTHKDNERTYLYSLSEFTAQDNGIRTSTNIFDRYNKGLIGAIPEPELINSLLEVRYE